jgi:phosphonate transport system permease protein
MGFLQPDFTSRWRDISQGSGGKPDHDADLNRRGRGHLDPIGIGAARNLAPRWIYFICRSIIAVSRALQEVIIAIFFVAMFGFGPFAGFLTLLRDHRLSSPSCWPTTSRRSTRRRPRPCAATGASWWQLVNYAVQPQVMPRLIGLSLYRLDINFRESAVIGIVGAGGIGATLNTAIDRYEYDSAGAILL